MKKISFLSLALLLIVTIVSAQNKKDIDWRRMGSNKNVTFYEIQDNFYQYWTDKTPQKGQSYKIFKRWEQKVAPRVYPSGNLSLLSSNYSNYMEWLKKQPSNENTFHNKNSASISNWTTLNGTSVATGYDTGSGRLNYIAFDPVDSQTMYVNAPDGGLWKTIDNGITWETNTDFLSIIGSSGLVIDPTNTNTMYLASGDRESDRRSIGVLKTTDGGSTWSPTGLVWTATDNYRISKIIMHPSNPSIMMVTTDGGIFRTTDGWVTNTLTSNPESFSDIEYKPGNSNIVYASSTYYDTVSETTAGYIYKSVDGGINWTIASGIPTSDVSRIEMAVTTANPAILYAIVGNANRGLKGVYKSTDSGDNFSLVYETTATNPNILHADPSPPASPTPGWNGGQADHDLAIAVSPLDANLVTIGGINQWQSTDGGVNWTRITHWLGVKAGYPGFQYPPTETKPYMHADIQYIAYSPHDDTTLYATCDGGISKGESNGTTWEDITNNIVVGQQTNIALSAINQNLFFAGLQDIGSLRATSPGNWFVLTGGDGEDGFIDRTNDNIIISSTTNGEFYRTKNGVTSYYPTTNGEWFSPIHQDPSVATLVYLGGRPALYYSTDILTKPDGDTPPNWTALGTPHAGNNILRFEIAPSNNQVIYTITNDRLSKSTDAGVNWTNITGTLPVGSAKLKNLTISNTDPNKVWVVFSGYDATSKVFKTINGGTTWIDLHSSTLPNLPINTIVHINDSMQDGIFIGADIGVYYIDNTQNSWSAYNNNLPNNAVQDLEIFYLSANSGKLRAATYGRGSWETDMNFNTLGINTITPSNSEAPILYPNPVTKGIVNVKLPNENSKYDFEVYDMLGKKIASGKIDSNSNEIILNASNGLYTIKLMHQGENIMFTQKIIVE